MRDHAVLIAIAAAAGVTWLVAGCSTSPPDGEPLRELTYETISEAQTAARENGWESQSVLLADGIVTSADYDQAISNTRVCAEHRANGITEPRLSPIDNLTREFGFPVGAMAEEAVWAASDECLQQHLWTVEAAYISTHEAVMDDDIRVASLQCMAERGFVMTGDIRSARDMAVRIPHESEPELTDCITQAALRLRPDLDSIGVSW
ncbi:hypothetical protein [Cellulomonas sp. IC4_254]|uniref:hypothetical protein n=1 Tax=Cellulomonas sp. IC4_254 TaxID=2714040 RepID=UPI001422B961|nr:hypothetical protein [Cellulomonas sp. IC4_254]NHT17269.1 hypothetical protein [Cellulomonas sp. IC4_254]